MRVYKHGSDITRILIGYWLVGNMSVYQEICLNLEAKKPTFFFIRRFIFGEVRGILDSYANPRLLIGFA